MLSECGDCLVYMLGEALLGEGAEVAHVDLVMGDREGAVGQAFATGLASPSLGHTPLLAVIRPNLISKPPTLIVPKVTVKNMGQAGRIFGPAQYAVAKAVADAVEERIIPDDKLDEWVIICGVFIHPEAKDDRKIFHYNYGATKLALRRAMASYPSLDRLMYEKDRAVHPLFGTRMLHRLWIPPYLQIAFDVPNLEMMRQVALEIPPSDKITFEIGAQIIKAFGAKVIGEFRKIRRDVFVMADLKTLDVAKVEVDEAFNETADGVVGAGPATKETLDSFIYEARRLGIYSFLDMTGVEKPVEKLKLLEELPDGVILHKPSDLPNETIIGQIKILKRSFKGSKLLIGVQGDVTNENIPLLIQEGTALAIVSRYVTQSRDVTRTVRDLLNSSPKLKEDIDLLRVHVE